MADAGVGSREKEEEEREGGEGGKRGDGAKGMSLISPPEEGEEGGVPNMVGDARVLRSQARASAPTFRVVTSIQILYSFGHPTGCALTLKSRLSSNFHHSEGQRIFFM